MNTRAPAPRPPAPPTVRGGKNSEYRPEGYFWAVHVEPAAVGHRDHGAGLRPGVHEHRRSTARRHCYAAARSPAQLHERLRLDRRRRTGTPSLGAARLAELLHRATTYPGDYAPRRDHATGDHASCCGTPTRRSTRRSPTPIAGCTKQFVGLQPRRRSPSSRSGPTRRARQEHQLQPADGAGLPPVGAAVHLHARQAPATTTCRCAPTSPPRGGTAVANVNPATARRRR